MNGIKKTVLILLMAAPFGALAQVKPDLNLEGLKQPKPELTGPKIKIDGKARPTNFKPCPQGPLSYGSDLFVDPTQRSVRWRPTICKIFKPIRFSISPPLDAPTGLHLNHETGVIAGRFSGLESDHSREVRTVTMHTRSPITRDVITVTTEFSYRFADQNPIRITGQYEDLNWEPFMGNREHTQPVVSGGEPPYRFRSSTVPSGFSIDRKDGAISGAPTHKTSTENVVSVDISDQRGRKVTDQFFIRLAPPNVARGRKDQCFIFVHGHQTLKPGADAIAISRSYWSAQSGTAVQDPEDRTKNFLGRSVSYDTHEDFIDIVTNNRTDKSNSRWVATGTPIREGDTRHRYAVVNYDAQQFYWVAAEEVARKIAAITRGDPDALGNVCAPNQVHGYVIVAHSMGGVVVSYINGNAKPASSNVQHRQIYKQAMERISMVVTVQSPLQGSEMSNVICEDTDNVTLWDDLVRSLPACPAEFESLITYSCFTDRRFNCDPGTSSLRTIGNFPLKHKIPPGRLLRTTLMAGGHVGILAGGIINSNRDLFGSLPFSGDNFENDGVVEIRSQWACDDDTFGDTNNNPDRGRHHYGPCRAGQTIREGFIPFVMTTENHDDGRNGFARGSIANPCRFLRDNPQNLGNLPWGTGSCLDNSEAEKHPDILELNIAQSIRCFLGDGAADHAFDYTCPAGWEPGDGPDNRFVSEQ